MVRVLEEVGKINMLKRITVRIEEEILRKLMSTTEGQKIGKYGE